MIISTIDTQYVFLCQAWYGFLMMTMIISMISHRKTVVILVGVMILTLSIVLLYTEDLDTSAFCFFSMFKEIQQRK
jgi:hypothetical protein